MPLGLKPCCAVCKTNSSSMWKKGNQGEILCNNCTGKSTSSGASGPSASSNTQQNNVGGKQSKQEIHRRSARLRSTKYKNPATEKKVSTKGKGRRHIFKLKNPIKAPESVSTIITSESVFYKVQRRIFPGRWSTWSLCATPPRSTSSPGAVLSPPFLSVQRKATSGPILDPRQPSLSNNLLATAISCWGIYNEDINFVC
ncbi:GATA zinc finger domain-containing protein 1 isoform X2 [Oncorhynchus clarkii lewisi]|uniref:GATA zinc finger domain-containing protein 1 isoform X2 n=1 Tax=Oncorhynchus clarkii lewisi TaxID=490388 RepID=UPI0039B93411